MTTLTNCGCGAPIQQPKTGRRTYCLVCKVSARLKTFRKFRPLKQEPKIQCDCGTLIQQPPTGRRKIYCISCAIVRDSENKQKHYLLNCEKIKARSRRHGVLNREINAFNTRVRGQKDPAFRIMRNARSKISKALGRNSKSAHAVELIGCRWSELRMWLEFQFQDGMTWENYGPVWHVDHIQPCASFDLADPEQQKECFNYKNLQPLFALDNMKKGAKW